MNQEKSVRILLEKEELGPAQQLARATPLNLQIEGTPQILDPFTAILVAGGVIAISKFVVDLIDKMRGGVTIDLTPTATYFVRRERAVPYGWAIIKAADGKSVSIETHDAPKDASERLLHDIIDGVLKNSGDIAKAATAALGASKVRQQDAST